MDILGHVGPAVGPQDLMSLPSLDGSPPQPSEARPWLQDGAVNFFSDILKSHYVPTRIEYNEDQTTHMIALKLKPLENSCLICNFQILAQKKGLLKAPFGFHTNILLCLLSNERYRTIITTMKIL